VKTLKRFKNLIFFWPIIEKYIVGLMIDENKDQHILQLLGPVNMEYQWWRLTIDDKLLGHCDERGMLMLIDKIFGVQCPRIL
jgi:hypothetical protein